jgi:hypothetical protein
MAENEEGKVLVENSTFNKEEALGRLILFG